MKQYMVPALASLILFASCKKEYRCTCVNAMAMTATPAKTTITIMAVNKKNAERKCKDTKYPDDFCALED